jgi:hypothetical protein
MRCSRHLGGTGVSIFSPESTAVKPRVSLCNHLTGSIGKDLFSTFAFAFCLSFAFAKAKGKRPTFRSESFANSSKGQVCMRQLQPKWLKQNESVMPEAFLSKVQNLNRQKIKNVS